MAPGSLSPVRTADGLWFTICCWAPTQAVGAMVTFAPRSVIALVELFDEPTTAPASIESTPPLPTPVPPA